MAIHEPQITQNNTFLKSNDVKSYEKYELLLENPFSQERLFETLKEVTKDNLGAIDVI